MRLVYYVPMMNRLLSRLVFVFLLASPFTILAPVYVEASTIHHKKVDALSSHGTFDVASLVVASSTVDQVRLTGTANVPKVRVIITVSDVSSSTASSTASNPSPLTVIYKSARISVHKGHWQVLTSEPLANGVYTVTLYKDNRNGLAPLASDPLYVGVQAPLTLTVLPVALLGGGTAPAGSTQPISYLQIINNGYASTTINGFWIKEDGSAPISSVIGFSSVDDQGLNRQSVGGVEGKTPFVNGLAYVPSGAVIGPRQMKLFTIKAQLSTSAGQYAGTNLMLDISGVDAPQAAFQNTFPVRGTTWAISQ